MDPEYSAKDWVEDFSWCVDLAARVQNTEGIWLRIHAYFRVKYPPPEDYRVRLIRFITAFNYLHCHMDELDAGHALVKGEDRHLVSMHLLIALWRVFSVLPLEELDAPLDSSLILRLVEEQYEAGQAEPELEETAETALST